MTVGAFAVAIALVLLAREFDSNLPSDTSKRIADAVPLVEPGDLRPGEGSGETASSLVELNSGAWVQIVGPDGKLRQQYLASRIDPEPDKWLAMTEPRAVSYLEDGRVVTLKASRGRAHVPNRELESGRFEGDVVVKVFIPLAGRMIDLELDVPTIIIESQVLQFDQANGEVTADGAIRITTDTVFFEGEDLLLQMTRDGKSIELLTVARPLGPIIIDRSRVASARASGGEPAPAACFFSPRDDEEEMYLFQLEHSVEIIRYAPTGSSRALGGQMRAVLALQSDLVSGAVAGSPFDGAMPVVEAAAGSILWGPPAFRLTMLAAAAATGAAQPTNDDLLVINYLGQLLLRPVLDSEPKPANSRDMLVWLDHGKGVIVDDKGRALRADSLKFELARDGERTTPRKLMARGAVAAADATQAMWAGDLDVKFDPVESDLAAADPMLGTTAISQVQASGPVQLQISNGARVFAQSVTAQPESGLVHLEGPDVCVARGSVAMDKLTHLDVDQAKRVAATTGPGRLQVLSQVVVGPGTKDRMERPVLDAVYRMQTTWTESMRLQDLAEQGAVVDLVGEVHARADPRPSEFDALDAATLHLEFDPETVDGNEAQGTQAGAAIKNQSPFDAEAGASMKLRRMLARGAVRLENQVWQDDARGGEPRLFRIEGEEVRYDAVSGDADVPGAGRTLIHNPAVAGQPPSEMDGTTQTKWTGSMTLRQTVDEDYRLSITQGVEMIHAGAAANDVLTLTCDNLFATLRRPEAPGASAARAVTDPRAIGFGGSARMRRVRGIGRCFVRARGYDIECEEFDYDLVTATAVLTAKPGRTVAVLQHGQGAPIRAERVVWDMASGRMRMDRAGGAASR